MSNMNLVVLTGRAGGDPEFKEVGDTELASLNFAVSEYAGQDKDEKTLWVTLNFWGNRTKVCEYITKGMKLTVRGRLQINRVENDDGETKYYTSVNVDHVELPDRDRDRDDAPKPSRSGGSKKKADPKKKGGKSRGKKKMPF